MNIFHEETIDGFDITLSFEPEEIIGDIDDEDTLAKINSGEYEYFIAIVTASKNGIELGSDTLGANIYPADKLNQFLIDGYYEDMVANAISEAKENVLELSSELHEIVNK